MHGLNKEEISVALTAFYRRKNELEAEIEQLDPSNLRAREFRIEQLRTLVSVINKTVKLKDTSLVLRRGSAR